MIRLYSNENFPIPAVEELRNLGCDVLTIQETGNAMQAFPDDQVLNFATDHKRAILTLNRKHFIALHNQSSKHAGIIVCSLDLDFKALATRIHRNISKEKSLAGKLIRINRPMK